MGSLQKVSNHLYLLTLSVFLFLLSACSNAAFWAGELGITALDLNQIMSSEFLLLKPWCYKHYLVITGIFFQCEYPNYCTKVTVGSQTFEQEA